MDATEGAAIGLAVALLLFDAGAGVGAAGVVVAGGLDKPKASASEAGGNVKLPICCVAACNE